LHSVFISSSAEAVSSRASSLSLLLRVSICAKQRACALRPTTCCSVVPRPSHSLLFLIRPVCVAPPHAEASPLEASSAGPDLFCAHFQSQGHVPYFERMRNGYALRCVVSYART
jgi:hypothetical protein